MANGDVYQKSGGAWGSPVGNISGPQGNQGPTGTAQNGGAITIAYTFSTTTTDSDPGSGTLRLNQATQNTATVIRADLLDALGMDWTSVLNTFDASNSVNKGQIRLVKADDATKFLIFNLTARAAPSGYRNFTVNNTGSSASSPFSNGDSILLMFSPVGDPVPNLTPTATKTSNYSAAVFDAVMCDCSAGGFTVTLPTTPSDGSLIAVKLVTADTADTSGRIVTIAPGGSDTIAATNLASGNITLVAVTESVLLEFKTNKWHVLSDERLLGLAINKVSAATTYQALVGDIIYADVSSASFTVTLPSNNVRPGDIITVILDTGDGASPVVKALTISTGNVLSSLQAKEGLYTLAFKLFCAGDNVTLVCTTNSGHAQWRVLNDNRLLHQSEVNANATGQSFNASTDTAATLNTVGFDTGGLADTANSRLVIRRNGTYQIGVICGFTSIVAGSRCMMRVQQNGTTVRESCGIANSSTSGMSSAFTMQLSAGDLITLHLQQGDGSSRAGSNSDASRARLSVTEQI